MDSAKAIFGLATVVLTYVAYFPYVRDSIKGKTKPHIFSWFLWSFISAGTFALQISHNAGFGALGSLSAAIACVTIFYLGLKKNGIKRIKRIDVITFILGLLAIFLWLQVDQPTVSVILLTVAYLLAYPATVRKSWRLPYSETLFTYKVNTLRFILSFLALKQHNFIATLPIVTWGIANGLFALYLASRRRALSGSGDSR
jgi:hypothetical protein